MAAPRIDDPVLTRFRRALDEAYGDNIERVVLYGSRARGNARPESDYDIAVFLNRPGSFNDEATRLATIETEILYDTGTVINAMPFQAGAYRHRAGLMSELRRDGVQL
jgi:predicted nucleotidyltransferase